MSVSAGPTKEKFKSFHVRLTTIDMYGNNIDPPKSLSNKIKIQPWTRCKELKNFISNNTGISSKNICLFFKNTELSDNLTMYDYNVIESKDPIISYQIQTKQKDFSIRVYGGFHCHLILKKVIEEITHGFMQHLKPQLIKEGTSGSYTLKNVDKEVIAIFKPIDEEAFAPNNQKGYVNKFGSASFRKGILSGEGSIREYIAFAIDDQGLFDVPPTTFVEIAHPAFNKNHRDLTRMLNFEGLTGSLIHNVFIQNLSTKNIDKTDNDDYDVKTNSKFNYLTRKFGSLQKFIKSTDVAGNFSFSLFTKDEVHKIAVLDLRIVNCDRNDENILVIKKKHKKTQKYIYKLVPIDHSLSFPDCIQIYDYELCWTGWDQVQEPFSDEMKKYIESIDIISDMEKIGKTVHLREDCWKMFRVSNTVLKVCAKYNLTLYEIGNLMYKTDYKNDSPSQVELLIQKTDRLTSEMKVDKRLRIFSASDEKEMLGLGDDVTNGESKSNAKKRKLSLLKRTTSDCQLDKLLENDEEEIDSKEKRSNNKKKSLKKDKDKENEEIVFDSPFNQMYFYHFEAFLIEFLKKTYPNNFTLNT